MGRVRVRMHFNATRAEKISIFFEATRVEKKFQFFFEATCSCKEQVKILKIGSNVEGQAWGTGLCGIITKSIS